MAIRSCSMCGSTTHNIRTCAAFELLQCLLPQDLPPVEVEEKRKLVCSNCGQCGHNKRTCSMVPVAVPVAVPVPVVCVPCVHVPQVDEVVKRKPRSPQCTNRAVQVTQVIDFEIFDEPWVWAPVRPVV